MNEPQSNVERLAGLALRLITIFKWYVIVVLGLSAAIFVLAQAGKLQGP